VSIYVEETYIRIKRVQFNWFDHAEEGASGEIHKVFVVRPAGREVVRGGFIADLATRILAESIARGTPQFIILPMLDKTVNYNPFTDFRMVSIFTKYEIIFMTGTASGIKSMKELAARMQSKESDVTYASIGQGPYGSDSRAWGEGRW